MTELERQIEKKLEYMGLKLCHVYKDRLRLYSYSTPKGAEITAMVLGDHVNIVVFEPTNADEVLRVSVDGEDLPNKIGCILAPLQMNY